MNQRVKEHGWSLLVCRITNPATDPGAQTERQGDAGPVRGLLGGKASPAAFLTRAWALKSPLFAWVLRSEITGRIGLALNSLLAMQRLSSTPAS